MTHPTPEKLSRLISAQQARWTQPQRRLVDCGEIAILRRLWVDSRQELLTLNNDVEEVDRIMTAIAERLPVGRDIMFWVHDPTANVTLPMFAEALDVTSEDLTRELFQGVSRPVLNLLSNQTPLTCPLCERRK